MKYFLKGDWAKEYTEVTRNQYIDAKGEAGFWPNEPGEIATISFDGHGINGKVEYEEEDKVHNKDDTDIETLEFVNWA